MKIKFKRLHDDAVLPSYAQDGDAGMDLTTVDDGAINKEYIQYKLGFSMEIPTGYVGLIFPRSSITKKDLMLKNSIGVIDSGYRGELVARFKSDRRIPCEMYSKGDRVAQLIVLPYPEIEPEWSDELSNTDRGTGGFGSTGK